MSVAHLTRQAVNCTITVPAWKNKAGGVKASFTHFQVKKSFAFDAFSYPFQTVDEHPTAVNLISSIAISLLHPLPVIPLILNLIVCPI